MSYSQRRYEALERLGMEQIPAPLPSGQHEELCELLKASVPFRDVPVWKPTTTQHPSKHTDPRLRFRVTAAQTAFSEDRPSGSSQARDVPLATPKSTEIVVVATRRGRWLHCFGTGADANAGRPRGAALAKLEREIVTFVASFPAPAPLLAFGRRGIGEAAFKSWLDSRGSFGYGDMERRPQLDLMGNVHAHNSVT